MEKILPIRLKRPQLNGADLAAAPALLFGTFLMLHFAISPVVALQNSVAWILALFCRVPVLNFLDLRRRAASEKILVGAIVLLAGTLFGPGIQGIHRWVKIGMLLECAPVVLPIVIIALGSIEVWSICSFVSLLVQTILFLQPDPSEATAFAFAISFSQWISGRPGPVLLSKLALWLMALLSWVRPDPLMPAQHVEEIVRLAFQIGPVSGAIAMISLLLLALPFFKFSLMAPRSSQRAISTSLAFYIATKVALTVCGRYPVPLLGYGVSSVLGYALSTGWLLKGNPLRASVGANQGSVKKN